MTKKVTFQSPMHAAIYWRAIRTVAHQIYPTQDALFFVPTEFFPSLPLALITQKICRR